MLKEYQIGPLSPHRLPPSCPHLLYLAPPTNPRPRHPALRSVIDSQQSLPRARVPAPPACTLKFHLRGGGQHVEPERKEQRYFARHTECSPPGRRSNKPSGCGLT